MLDYGIRSIILFRVKNVIKLHSIDLAKILQYILTFVFMSLVRKEGAITVCVEGKTKSIYMISK